MTQNMGAALRPKVGSCAAACLRGGAGAAYDDVTSGVLRYSELMAGHSELGARASDAAASDRSCGACQACCVVYHIDGLEQESPRWVPCHKLCDAGCGIYTDRPDGCRTFRCAWLGGWGEDDQRPDRLGVLIERLQARPRIGVEEKILATELAEDSARTPRARAVLLELKRTLPVVLVPHKARGFENFGRALPDDF
jgi:hypothetical protein